MNFLARPVAGCTQADHLLFDDSATLRFPLPNAALEFLASQVLTANFLLGELAFHDELRGDPGVIHPGSQSVRCPRMRCQRTSMSIWVCSSMWPMWIEPVMFGGGSAIENTGPRPEFSARNSFSSNQVLAQRRSIS